MKKIEILYGELGNMYGEIYNPMFLEKATDEIELIFTGLNDEPKFVKEKVDMIYMSNIRDLKMYGVIDKLMPYKEKIKELIEAGTIFLLTGNAIEIFGSYIDENGGRKEALGLFDYHLEKDFSYQNVGWVKGMFEEENIEIIGHRNQFSRCYNITHPFINVTGGNGSDLEHPIEGVHYKNFFATYLLGPFLIMNPLFAKYLLGLMDIKEMKFEECAMQAYEHRMEYFHKPDARFIMDHYG